MSVYITDANDPRGWTIACDREGWYLEDEYGEDRTPKRRFSWWHDAKRHQDAVVKEFMDNYEPPEKGDAFSGGFADNH